MTKKFHNPQDPLNLLERKQYTVIESLLLWSAIFGIIVFASIHIIDVNPPLSSSQSCSFKND